MQRQWFCLALLLTLTTPLAASSETAPISGHGKAIFGTPKRAVEAAFPNSTWTCEPWQNGAEFCNTKNPELTGMDSFTVTYIDGVVAKTTMTTTTVTSNVELLTAWDKYKDIFAAKYGRPSIVGETMLLPYDDDRAEFLRYGISAIRSGKCLYAAIWSAPTMEDAPGLSLVMKPGWLLIAYESTSFQKFAKRLAEKDASQF